MNRDEVLAKVPGDGEDVRRARDVIADLAREHAQERERLLAMFDDAPVFMTMIEGPELRITAVNRRVREMPEGAQMVGKSVRELYRADNPILAIVERVYATGIEEIVHGLPPYFESGAHAKRYFTRKYAPIRGADGKVRAILTVGYEVTEEVRARLAHEESQQRSQAELQRLFALLEEAPVMLAVVEGPEWCVTMANRYIRQLFGDRTVVGMSVRGMVQPGNQTLAAIERVYASGRSETFELLTTITGFTGRAFNVALVPIRDADGTIARIMAAAVEITEQRRTRESLERQATDLEIARSAAVEAGRAKDQFLAMLSHELRNPLAPMRTAVQVIRLEGGTSPAIDIMERQVRHLTRLVEDLLDISRITRGMVVLERQDVELVKVVNRALEMVSPLLEQRGHRVVTKVGRGLGVSGDPERLAQVVANLVTNAAKYSDPGSEIRIMAARAGASVLLSVADDGVGIAPEVLAKVFDLFVQQPQTLARSHGGLGIGLSIVKSLVEAHGGAVSAYSSGLGRGSKFVVELPGIELRDEAGSAASPTPPNRGAIRDPGAPAVRILIVDDNYDAADILKIALEARGYLISIAYDGPSALELAKTVTPQIALVDIGLPVMNGYDLAGRLRAAYDFPLVAVTGYGQETDRERSRVAGFVAHMVKPVDLEELAELAGRLTAPKPTT